MSEELRVRERAISRVLWELHDFLPDLVLIGGWVPFLYQQYAGLKWNSRLSMTRELDLLIAHPLSQSGGDSIVDALKRAGFEQIDSGGAQWQRGEAVGERVEFMITHVGTAGTRSSVVPVDGEKGLGAISLEGLEILSQFSTELQVPVGIVDSDVRLVQIRVPTLAAYAINKACTFPYRPSDPFEGASSKRAKDILYLRDIMAAGSEVTDTIASGIRDIAGSEHSAAVDRARSNVYLLLNGAMQHYLADAAEALGERDRVTRERAQSDIRGHLADLFDMLRND